MAVNLNFHYYVNNSPSEYFRIAVNDCVDDISLILTAEEGNFLVMNPKNLKEGIL